MRYGVRILQGHPFHCLNLRELRVLLSSPDLVAVIQLSPDWPSQATVDDIRW